MGFSGGRGAAARHGEARACVVARGMSVLAFALCGLLILVGESAWAGCISGQCNYPLVTIAVPANSATYGTGQSITISGRATGDVVNDAWGDGHPFPINRVEVYNGSTFVANATLGASGVDNNDWPWRDYSYTFSPLAAGTYTLKVNAYDSGSKASGFTQVTVTVANVNDSKFLTGQVLQRRDTRVGRRINGEHVLVDAGDADEVMPLGGSDDQFGGTAQCVRHLAGCELLDRVGVTAHRLSRGVEAHVVVVLAAGEFVAGEDDRVGEREEHLHIRVPSSG